MNKLVLIFPFALAAQMTFAQGSTPIGLDAERNLQALRSQTGAMVQIYDNRYEGVKGTPFFNEEWSKTTITAGNTLFSNLDVKYDVLENKILYRDREGKDFVLQPYKVDSFVLTDNKTKQEYSFRKFPALAAQDELLAKRFSVVLYDGKQVQLVMVPEKHLAKADYKGAYNSGNKYDEFINLETFYFIGPGNKVSKTKLNKKNLLKVLPDKQDKVQEFISTNNLDLNTGAGWAKALAYYESL